MSKQQETSPREPAPTLARSAVAKALLFGGGLLVLVALHRLRLLANNSGNTARLLAECAGIVLAGLLVMQGVRWGALTRNEAGVSRWPLALSTSLVVVAMAVTVCFGAAEWWFDPSRNPEREASAAAYFWMRAPVSEIPTLYLAARAVDLAGVLSEELVFRSLLVPVLRTKASPATTVAVAALVFLAVHMGFYGYGFYFPHLLGGAVFTVVFLRTRSVLASSAVHLGANVGVVLVNYARAVGW